MLDASWVALPAIPIAVWILTRGVRQRLGLWTIGLRLVVLVHLAATVGVVFFPFPYQGELIREFRAYPIAGTNLVPLTSLIHAIATGRTPSVVDQSIGNLVMLMPAGIYIPLLWPRARRAGTMVLIGLGASLAIELAQLVISALPGYTYKITDVDDVILNTAGVAFGFGVFWLISHWFPRSMARAPIHDASKVA